MLLVLKQVSNALIGVGFPREPASPRITTHMPPISFSYTMTSVITRKTERHVLNSASACKVPKKHCCNTAAIATVPCGNLLCFVNIKRKRPGNTPADGKVGREFLTYSSCVKFRPLNANVVAAEIVNTATFIEGGPKYRTIFEST